MFSEYAYCKIQSVVDCEEHYVQQLPCILCSKRLRPTEMEADGTQIIKLTNSQPPNLIHGVIFQTEEGIKLLPLTKLIINGKPLCAVAEVPTQSLSKLAEWILEEGLTTQAVSLKELSRLEIEVNNAVVTSTIEPSQVQSRFEIFYLCLPCRFPQRPLSGQTVQVQKQTGNINHASNTKPSVNSVSFGTKWSTDDHEQLKKLLLHYGYGRWKQIQRGAISFGGKIDQKPLSEVKAYANSFLRALGLSLPEDQTNLKMFLQKLIEQNTAEFQQFQPNLKEWQQHIMLPQRSVQYTKRLQLLFRVKTLIRKYREDAMRNMAQPDRRKVSWDGLLNFIPLGLLFGQRPALWWVKKNDIDLLLGVYKYGYANYLSIRAAKQYCFQELDKAETYQDFPVADNLTRRLKKLINTIVKIQQNQGEIDFDDEAESQQDEKLWSDNQKKALFNLVIKYGVPIGTDSKSNWIEVRQKLKGIIKDFAKTPSQVEKMVSRIRWNCQEIIADEKLRDESAASTASGFKISFESAAKFNKQINILEFVRRSIILMEPENYKVFLKEAEERLEILPKEHSAFIESGQGAMKIKDEQLLAHVNKHGICSYFDVGEVKVLARLEWLCDVYRQVKEKLQEKKKKYKTFDESTKKKGKFELCKDKDGNIKFPININPSLILVATGTICTNQNYHSEHNLFPIGYISIRTHASIKQKGLRARYRCEILEGDGKPIYKVVPEEDPQNPIIRDSSTGCWVHICSKVNDLQDNKKEKVTISGTERFGLLENNVVRLLEDLPNAEKCTKYKFKKNLPKETQ